MVGRHLLACACFIVAALTAAVAAPPYEKWWRFFVAAGLAIVYWPL